MAIPQNTLLKYRVKQLYMNGAPVSDIAASVGRSETTIYGWLKDMHVDTGANKGTTAASSDQQAEQPQDDDLQSYDKYIDGSYSDGKTEGMGLAASDTYFRVICALYWGEGRIGDFDDEETKEVSLASLDPTMVKMWVSWLLRNKVTTFNEIRIHASLNSDMSDNELRHYWAVILNEVGYKGDIKIKRLDQMVTSAVAKQRKGSAYATVYSSYLRGMITGGITYIKRMYSK